MIELFEGPIVQATYERVAIGEFSHFEPRYDYVQPKPLPSKFIMNIPDFDGSMMYCLIMNKLSEQNNSNVIWKVR